MFRNDRRNWTVFVADFGMHVQLFFPPTSRGFW